MNRELFLYVREHCGLCTGMLEEIDALLGDNKPEIHLIYIDNDPELIHRYGARLPVLVGRNSEICEIRLDPEALHSYLNGN